MLTQEQGFATLDGMNVYDAIIITQIIDKLLRGGLVAGKEISYVAGLRSKMLVMVKQAIGIDIDNPEAASSPNEQAPIAPSITVPPTNHRQKGKRNG